MTMLRGFLIVAWLIAVGTMVRATAEMGFAAGLETFFADFAHPWRAQFDSDLLAHLVLMAAWIVYREPSVVGRFLCAFGAMFFGGAFSFLYVALAATRAGGDPRKLLLGRHA